MDMVGFVIVNDPPPPPPPPRPIEGSVGSRIRLILGKTGSEWLLLLNEDDGDLKWQTQDWSSIPHKVANQINNCVNKGRYVKEVDFDATTGAWYMYGIKRDNTGGHSWWGNTEADTDIKTYSAGSVRLRAWFGSTEYGTETYAIFGPNDSSFSRNLSHKLQQRVQRLVSRNKRVKFIRLFANNGFFISDDEGTLWGGIGTHCTNELREAARQVDEVAVAGDGSWVVIRPNGFSSSTAVDSRLTERLTRFYREQKQRVERRTQEIREYHERIEHVERERREQEEQRVERRTQAIREYHERIEREERERREREEREAEELRLRTEREAREAAAERERVEREARIAQEEAEKQARVDKLEDILERKLLEEVETIRELEEHLEKRKRILKTYIQELPESRRFIFEDNLSSHLGKQGKAECVVCQNNDASRAVVPCGHHCLCDECAEQLASTTTTSRLCPLCRGVLSSTLKIFTMK